ncbi:MAG TPA: hypothetical protein VLN57_20905 [Xanthobacteraceae bacterium]|nr:hypothetical protein [Xanthobacteraceae bacterium]
MRGSAISDLREMVERVIQFVSDRGDQWERPGTPEHLLIENAKLMKGIADGLERNKIDMVLK